MAKTQEAAKPGRKKGQPTAYRTEYAEQARLLCSEGFTDKKLAAFFKITEQTVNNWKRAHPEFFESIKAGKDDYDTSLVEASLRHRATGYEHPDEDIRVVNGELVRTAIVKRYPPDTTAAIFWLKNRNPGRWRDKQVVSHDVEDESPLASLLAAVSGTPIKPKAD